MKDAIFDRWWPLSQSLLLVRASIRDTATALEADGTRLGELSGQEFQYEWVKRSSIDDLFRKAGQFPVDGPTRYYALPTTGSWTIIWNNSAHCTGHDSLAHCLTHFWGLETFHFYSTDKSSTQLAGTHFSHRLRGGTREMIQRDVYCCDQGGRWHFEQYGEPLAEEDLAHYGAKRKRERLNEQRLMELLGRLGIYPWRETTYDFTQSCFYMTNAKSHEQRTCVDFQSLRRKLTEEDAPAEDQEIEGPPGYLRGICRTPDPDGPARLLTGGEWCGHGEKQFWIYDVALQHSDVVSVRLPAAGSPGVVELFHAGKDAVAVYDCRLHPASVFSESKAKPVFQPPFPCPGCGSTSFRAAVGFEVPTDYQSANDTSWFALALECPSCGFAGIVYDDETA